MSPAANYVALHAQARAVLQRKFGTSAVADRPQARPEMRDELARELELSTLAAEKLLLELESSGASRGDDARDARSEQRVNRDEATPAFEPLPDCEPASGETPAVDLLLQAIEARATDIHIDPNDDRIDVRFRIDGRLVHANRLERKAAAAIISQLKLMADLDIAEPFRSKEGRLRLPDVLAGYQVRLTTARVVDGEAAALRLLDSRRLRRPLDSLGLSPDALALVRGMLTQGEGLILVTGPTNAGKTTTVYSMLHELDNGQRNIVTIEDPVEYDMPSFVQMGVDPRHDVTMTSGLRTLLRMDPDVVLVGEIRDAETAEIAMRAASSGKLVLSTLHTRDVASTVTALRDLHVDNRSLAGNLAGIVSQRLVRCVCKACGRSDAPTAEDREIFKRAGRDAPDTAPQAVGCDRCSQTGYFERIGVFEVAAGMQALGAGILAGASEDELRGFLRRERVPGLVDDGLDKVCAGTTTAEEVQAMRWGAAAPRRGLAMPASGRVDSHGRPYAAPPNSDSTHRVVIFAAPDDAGALRDLLVERLNMHPSDAMFHARHAPGILPDLLTREAAEHIAGAVNEIGLHAEALPRSEIPDFEHSEAVHHVRCLETGLEIVELHGQPEMIVPWSDIQLVSVGQIPQDEERHFVLGDEITAARRAAPTDCFVTRASGPELWFVRRDPLKAFRIDHERMNYEYLGSRKSSSATRNFRVFVEELISRTPSAYVTPATRAFVEHGPTRHFEFDSSDDLRRYTVFHLLIRFRAETTAE